LAGSILQCVLFDGQRTHFEPCVWSGVWTDCRQTVGQLHGGLVCFANPFISYKLSILLTFRVSAVLSIDSMLFLENILFGQNSAELVLVPDDSRLLPVSDR